jgi:hypothetical protein
MKYLESGLLEQGLSPKQITEAVVKAVGLGKSTGLDIGHHYRPVSGIEKQAVSHCKLSQMAYGPVLMDADAELPAVGDFQVSVLQQYIGGYQSF